MKPAADKAAIFEHLPVRTAVLKQILPAIASQMIILVYNLADTYFVSEPRRRLAIECAKVGLDAEHDLAPNDISLYLGIPFCPTRCAYCSFVSNSVEKSFHLVEPYLEALFREIDSAAVEQAPYSPKYGISKSMSP